MMKSYIEMSHRLFGGLSKQAKAYFMDVREDIQQSGIDYTLDEYISVALFTTIATFFVETVTLAFIFGIFGIEPLIAVFLSATLSVSISGVLFFFFYSYPAMITKNREKKIDKTLPFAVSYMATLSSAKLPPIFLFRTIAMFGEYGEITREAKNIVRSVDVFGMTFFSAIKGAAKKSPSKRFKDLLWGMNTVTSSGGDLTGYLSKKSDELISDYRRRIRKYSQDLSLFVEVYLTLIITGSIFFIVLSSIISAISGGLGTILIQSFVVFILLPLLSVGFILIIKSASPVD